MATAKVTYDRTCAYQGCRRDFVTTYQRQRYCGIVCKSAYWHEQRHGAPHKCPLCGQAHDPEEPEVLMALEAELGLKRYNRTLLEAFIARRRAIIAAGRGGPEPN